MRAPWLLAALLFVPTAVAWRADFDQSFGDAPRVADSLLLSGALNLTFADASIAAPAIARADFGRSLTVVACMDVGGEPQDCSSSQQVQQPNTHARIRVLGGGMSILPRTSSSHTRVMLASGTAMLTGANLTANRIDLTRAVLLGGASVLTTDADALDIRPFGTNVTLQVLGDTGTQTYNGSGVTLIVTHAEDVVIESMGIAVGSAQSAEVRLTEAPLRVAETGPGLEPLFALIRSVIPLDAADRRADLATAFGPFQLVPAVINGAAAARQNFTLNGAPQEGLVVIRLQDARLALTNQTWKGTGNASFLQTESSIVPEPGARTTPPIIIPGLLLIAALVGRWLTRRVAPAPRAQRVTTLIRLAGLILLALLAEALLASLLGFHPLYNWTSLAGRSRAQLLLLVGSIALVAYLVVGLTAESIARSVFAWRARPDAARIPALVGLVAAAILLLAASAPLISLVARIVRL